MWIFPWIKLTWHSCSMWDKLGWLNCLWQFLCEKLSSFNLKELYYLYAWPWSLCEGRTSFCTGLIPRKICRYLCFWLSLLHPVLYFFFLYWSPSSSLCTLFDFISSNIEEVLSINPPTVFVFGDFTVHHKDWLVYSGGTDRPGELCYNFTISNGFTQMVNFTWIPGCDSHSPALWDLFISSNASICSTMGFPPLRNSDHVVVSVSIVFLSNSKRDAPFHPIYFDYSCADWGGLHDHVRDVLLLLLVNFVSEFRLELMFISLIVSLRSNLTHLHCFLLLVLLP